MFYLQVINIPEVPHLWYIFNCSVLTWRDLDEYMISCQKLLSMFLRHIIFSKDSLPVVERPGSSQMNLSEKCQLEVENASFLKATEEESKIAFGKLPLDLIMKTHRINNKPKYLKIWDPLVCNICTLLFCNPMKSI